MKVSVIIPTLNESSGLANTIAKMRENSPCEILVGDGGSDDGTLAIARQSGARVIHSQRGRARQMNAAANEAVGDLLLFLHADTVLDPAGYRKMRETMRRNNLVGGAFGLQLDSDKTSLKVISQLATWRSKYCNLVYGDQAIFVRKDIFREMGGYPTLPICEDLAFFRALQKKGRTMVLREKARTSPRRWLSEGTAYTTFRNIAIAIMFLLGFPPKIMARWYRSVR